MSILQALGGLGDIVLLSLIVFGISLLPAYLAYRIGRATGDDDAVLWAAVTAAVSFLGLSSAGSSASLVFNLIIGLLPGITVLLAYAYVRQYDRP